MIDGGLFTAPPRFEHSGAALLDADGRLVGIGSLWVSDALEAGAAFPGNMFVPIDLLTPLLDDILATGKRRGPARPWVGLYSEEIQGHVVVTRVLPDSPAAKAGLKRGDIILGVGGEAIGRQSEFYTRLWELRRGRIAGHAARAPGQAGTQARGAHRGPDGISAPVAHLARQRVKPAHATPQHLAHHLGPAARRLQRLRKSRAPHAAHRRARSRRARASPRASPPTSCASLRAPRY